MQDLLRKIFAAKPSIQLGWVIWLVVLVALIVITINIGIKSYKLMRRRRKIPQ